MGLRKLGTTDPHPVVTRHGQDLGIYVDGAGGTGAHLAARFYDFVGFSDKRRIERLRYMRRNPKAGLVLEPEQRAWSSYRSYAYDESVWCC